MKQEREARGLLQPQLGELVGMSQQALSLLERRDSKTSDKAVELADALQVSVRWLLTGKGDKNARDWPFDRVARARWDACDPTDRGYVQAAINRALDECEQARAAGDSGKQHPLAA